MFHSVLLLHHVRVTKQVTKFCHHRIFQQLPTFVIYKKLVPNTNCHVVFIKIFGFQNNSSPTPTVTQFYSIKHVKTLSRLVFTTTTRTTQFHKKWLQKTKVTVCHPQDFSTITQGDKLCHLNCFINIFDENSVTTTAQNHFRHLHETTIHTYNLHKNNIKTLCYRQCYKPLLQTFSLTN